MVSELANGIDYRRSYLRLNTSRGEDGKIKVEGRELVNPKQTLESRGMSGTVFVKPAGEGGKNGTGTG